MRSLVVSQLRDLGYNILEACDGPSACTILDGPAEIDLLFTDVLIPGGFTGHKLAEEAKKRRPGLKTAFTTGYSNAIGAAGAGDLILHKPYRKADLAVFIRKALGMDTVEMRGATMSQESQEPSRARTD